MKTNATGTLPPPFSLSIARIAFIFSPEVQLDASINLRGRLLQLHDLSKTLFIANCSIDAKLRLLPLWPLLAPFHLTRSSSNSPGILAGILRSFCGAPRLQRMNRAKLVSCTTAAGPVLGPVLAILMFHRGLTFKCFLRVLLHGDMFTGKGSPMNLSAFPLTYRRRIRSG